MAPANLSTPPPIASGQSSWNAERAAPEDVVISRPLSIEAARAELAALEEKERDLELELEKLYARATLVCQSESRRLAYVGEQHRQLPAAVSKLQETLQNTSAVADELSDRVRRLDTVCNRAAEALKLVDDVLEIKECADLVRKAIVNEDFEQAAKYVARYRSAKKECLPLGADDNSIRILEQAEADLAATVRTRFEAAIVAKDTADVSRFAKLFHPLDLAHTGVEKYTEYICRSFADKCARDFKALLPTIAGKRVSTVPNPYEQALTEAFKEIAAIVQENQQSVEEHFGPENFILVLRGMVEEADTQAMNVIERFAKDNANIFDEKVFGDIHEVDQILEETALMILRSHQFHSYVDGVAADVANMISDKASFEASLPDGFSPASGMPLQTKLHHRVQGLANKYVSVENNFLTRSVDKALRESDPIDPLDLNQLTTPVVDESFFILRQSMLRASATYDIDALCAMVNFVFGSLRDQVIVALRDDLSESARTYSSWVTHEKHLLPPPKGENPLDSLLKDPEGKYRHPLTAGKSWPHALNNLQESISFLFELKDATLAAFNENFPPGGPDKDKHQLFHHVLITSFESCKEELDSMHATQCKECVTMFRTVLAPSLSPLRNLEYNITEPQFEDLQVNDPFVKCLVAQVEVIHHHLLSVLNTGSLEDISLELTGRVVKQVERMALQKRFSLLGALQLEGEVRALCSFFTNLSEQAVRPKFARLFEMVTLLSLESPSELHEMLAEQRLWKLSHEEMRTLLPMRVDLGISVAELDRLFPT